MALSSMTGFARCNGTSGAYAWAWELRSVNGKNLDLRLRLPPGRYSEVRRSVASGCLVITLTRVGKNRG